MISTQSSEAVRNLKMLKEFFAVPENYSDPQAFLRKRRVLAKRLYDATQSRVEPADAFPARYDPVTRSPKEDLSKYIFRKN